MKHIVCFGEIMLRISPWEKSDRLFQTSKFRIEPAGSESNVAVNLANLGLKSVFLSSIPKNELGLTITRYLSKYGVNTSFLRKKENGRLGIFWNENGVDIRASYVIYDRENSAFSITKMEEYEWEDIRKECAWFHTSGISPALTRGIYEILKSALEDFAQNEIPISIDLNYRGKLWNWISGEKESQIPKLMEELCSKAYLICGNEEDFQLSLGIKASSNSEDIIECYSSIASQVFNKMPNVRYIAVSLRRSISASVNDWSGLLFTTKEKELKLYKGKNYHLSNIVDRVGAGDSFCAGIIYGLMKKKEDPQFIVNFAVTYSALKHTIRGDVSEFSVKDIEKTMQMLGSGRIIR